MSAWPEEKESSTNSNNHLEFEDNFEVKLADKLDDSHEYLLKLENRLRKLKKDPSVLKQLSERREAAIENLLNTSERVTTESDLNFDQPIQQSLEILESAQEIIRHIRPFQPQTVGEVVHIIKYDQLNEEYNSENNSDNSSIPDR